MGQKVEQLLATKLFIPPTRPNIVPRPRLIDQLNACAYPGCKLILISAPAGFGKTTLVSEWVKGLGKTVPSAAIAWLSLDEGDNDPARFLAYFIAALNQAQGVEASIGKGSLNMIQSPQPPSTEAVLTPLINEIAAISDRIILVLDDYHVIESTQVDDILTFLLEYLPPRTHLVIATREDPHLQLPRLRVRGQLTELRVDDLRFTSSEAAEFLNQVMGLKLAAEDIAALERRTEGWIAGLQLAAISMQGHGDATDFIRSFSGSHRLVLDYLIEEVLDQLSESIQIFLLQTAILDRLTGPLCDALTGQEDGQTTLEMLEHANLFIVPLDDERCWYRYHHLFADLLRQRMRQTQAELVTELSHKASEWYETNGYIYQAIEHSLLAEDYERAAELIEDNVETMWGAGYSKLRHWLFILPDELICSKPELCIYKAWYLLSSGRLDVADQVLSTVELSLESNLNRVNGTTTQERDKEYDFKNKRLRGMIATTRAFAAFYRVEIENLIEYANKALEYLPVKDTTWRVTAYNALGDGYDFKGEIIKSYYSRLEALEVTRTTGSIYPAMIASAKLAINLRLQGRLQEVQEVCRQQMQFAAESGMTKSDVAGWSLAIWGETMAELNDLEGAIRRAKAGVEITERGGDLAILGWSYICLLRVLYSTGDIKGAEEIIQKIENISLESYGPPWILNYKNAWQARIWLVRENLGTASQWVKEQGLNIRKEVAFLREMENLALVRILIAQGKLAGTTTFLQRLLKTADEAGGRYSSKIEILMLQAMVFQAQGDINQAISSLVQAIELAEPRGFIRIFVDEGPPMARLLYEGLNHGIEEDYIRELLAAFPVVDPGEVDPRGKDGELIEPLSEREIEVLQLIADGLTSREIAARLYLSPNTVKVHSRNINSKLGVNNRVKAVTKARTLGILPFT
jgi:LuxR family maltose regulon positive regulatory protein